jgi:hypothetical protein
MDDNISSVLNHFPIPSMTSLSTHVSQFLCHLFITLRVVSQQPRINITLSQVPNLFSQCRPPSSLPHLPFASPLYTSCRRATPRHLILLVATAHIIHCFIHCSLRLLSGLIAGPTATHFVQYIFKFFVDSSCSFEQRLANPRRPMLLPCCHRDTSPTPYPLALAPPSQNLRLWLIRDSGV